MSQAASVNRLSNAPSPESFVVQVSAELDEELLRSRWEQVSILLRLSMMSGLHMDIGATLRLLVQEAGKIADHQHAVAYFWNPTEENCTLRVATGAALAQRDKLATGNALQTWTMQYRRPMIVERGQHPEADAVLHLLNAGSALSVPVLVSGRVMGSMQLFSSEAGAYHAPDAQMLWMLSRIAENLLAREQVIEGLLHFAFTDHLTGLKTRGYFEQQLELEIKRSDRSRKKFVLLMLDIDHFKTLNDTFGHHVGDHVLREVADVLTEDMREVDTVARYGGEEFVIILPETTDAEGYAVAQRIRASVERTQYFGGKLQPQQALSISIGMAVYGSDTTDRRELVRFADQALYWAKGQGRNRVVRYTEMMRERRKEVS